MFVAMMNLSGGSAAFGEWASTKVKSRKHAQFTTILLGILIFVDDYFNCLTVGSVMKPLSDKFNISRAKLAYLIDATAAPVCIIAPISSWAAAVSGFVQGQNGLTIFIRAIPYNFYALFTIVMMFAIVAMNFDYSKMAIYEKNAIENGDLLTVHENLSSQDEEISQNHNGHVADLIVPVIVLIICCLMNDLHRWILQRNILCRHFCRHDAAASLSLGSRSPAARSPSYTTVRARLTFRECMDCVPEGFKQMVSPILVLTLAWSLKCMTDSLGLAPFVAGMVEKMQASWMALIPAVLFVISLCTGLCIRYILGNFRNPDSDCAGNYRIPSGYDDSGNLRFAWPAALLR